MHAAYQALIQVPSFFLLCFSIDLIFLELKEGQSPVFVISLALALGSICGLTYSCPVVEIVTVIWALKCCKKAIGFVFKDYVYKLKIEVIRVGPRLDTIRCWRWWWRHKVDSRWRWSWQADIHGFNGIDGLNWARNEGEKGSYAKLPPRQPHENRSIYVHFSWVNRSIYVNFSYECSFR